MTKRPNLSLILPVHNEASSVQKTLSDCERVLRAGKISYEMLCVENGSSDGSLSVLKTYAKDHKRVFIYQSGLGWGNAVREGIRRARGELVCYMVSDGQVPASSVVTLYQAFKKNTDKDIVLFKIWRTSRENSVRLINSRLFAVFSVVLFGFFVRDVNATPKLLPRIILQKIPLTATNIAVDLELLLGVRALGLRFVEIPVPGKPREAGRSTTKWKTVWEMIRWMVKKRFSV